MNRNTFAVVNRFTLRRWSMDVSAVFIHLTSFNCINCIDVNIKCISKHLNTWISLYLFSITFWLVSPCASTAKHLHNHTHQVLTLQPALRGAQFAVDRRPARSRRQEPAKRNSLPGAASLPMEEAGAPARSACGAVRTDPTRRTKVDAPGPDPGGWPAGRVVFIFPFISHSLGVSFVATGPCGVIDKFHHQVMLHPAM